MAHPINSPRLQLPRWIAALAFSLFLASYDARPASQPGATGKAWQQYTAILPQREAVRLNLDGRMLSLAETGKDRVVEHFRNQPPDELLLSRVASFQNARNAQRGLALRQGKLQLGKFPSVSFPQDPTWAENPLGHRNWAWNLHCLAPLQFLLAAHAQTASPWFLERCEYLITDWAVDNYRREPPSEFSWSDHSTALRLENLLYFFEYGRLREVSSEALIVAAQSIYAHASVLSDPAFYVEHTNHGLDQSYILYLAGAAFPEFEDAERWREVGRRRTVNELAFAFTPEGVHVENSPSYHFILLRRALQIEAMFQHYQGDAADTELRDLLDDGFGFAAHILRPDGKIPVIGDSQADRVRDHSSFRVLAGQPGYEHFRYSVSLGRDGIRPQETFRVFPKSGYAVLRDSWDADGFGQSLHLVFKAGFLSTYHRHDDDLSFVLFNKGEDWIIDAGLYAYQEQDAFRQYVRSAGAHNVVTVDALSQGRSADYLDRSRIVSFEVDSGTGSVQGSHDLYPDLQVTRELSYSERGIITIRDRVESKDDEEHTYRVLFHVPSDKIVSLGGKGATIRSLRSGTVLELRTESESVKRVRSVIGQETPSYQGWSSPAYGEREASVCLVFEGQASSWSSTIELQFRDP